MKRKLFGLIGAMGIALGLGSCKSQNNNVIKDNTKYVHIHLKAEFVDDSTTNVKYWYYGKLVSYEFLSSEIIKCVVIWDCSYIEPGVGQKMNTDTPTTCLFHISDVILFSAGICNICHRTIA